jgi:curli production assembly/transport component CsgE
MVKCRTLLLISVLLMVISSPVFSQQKDSTQVKETKILELLESIKRLSAADSSENNTIPRRTFNDSLYLEIDQLIINETISKLGIDFQEIFYGKWNWPSGLSDPFIIVIKERPVFGTNTQIEIEVNDIKVFESFLQPRYDVLEEMAGQAIEFTMQYILNYQEVLKQLSGDDMAGTGIY